MAIMAGRTGRVDGEGEMTWKTAIAYVMNHTDLGQRARALHVLNAYQSTDRKPPESMDMINGDLYCIFLARGMPVTKVFRAGIGGGE